MKKHLSLAFVCLGLLAGCAKGPMGDMGPLGPSGPQGAPGQDYSAYTKVLEQHFDTQSTGTTPAGWTISPNALGANELSATISGALWTSPGQALRLSAAPPMNAAAFVPFSAGTTQDLLVTFDLYRGEAAPSFDVRGFRVGVVAAGKKVGDLFFQSGPTGDSVLLVFNGGQVERPLGSRSYFDRFSISYEAASGLTDILINGSPVASRLPVATAAPYQAGSSSYLEWRFVNTETVTYSVDTIVVSTR